MVCGAREIVSNGYVYQKYPSNNRLTKNMNLGSEELLTRVSPRETGCFYKLSTVLPSEDSTEFRHIGSGPNFQGGLISQCTCRHDIRAKWYSLKEWKSKWIAGITSKTNLGASYLFYLIKVQKTFSSYKSLFDYYTQIDPQIIEAKSAEVNRLGDLYIPNEHITDLYDLDNYRYHPEHSHRDEKNRLKDINYPKYTQHYMKSGTSKHATLLLGDPNHSYLWSKPLMKFRKDNAPRSGKYDSLTEFLQLFI